MTWLLSVLWIVALINSFNMLDNMDALSAGIAAIAAGLLAAVLLTTPAPDTRQPQLFVGGFLLVLVGALLGFLWHNRPVAKLFMGDAGSYFVGFCIAICTLQATFSSYDSTSQHTVFAPLCVLAVPLYDLVTVLWIRLREGRSPFQADKSHFSHRLVELGLTKGQAVLTIYLTTATCGLGALLLYRVDWVGAAIILLMILCVLSLIAHPGNDRPADAIRTRRRRPKIISVRHWSGRTLGVYIRAQRLVSTRTPDLSKLSRLTAA